MLFRSKYTVTILACVALMIAIVRVVDLPSWKQSVVTDSPGQRHLQSQVGGNLFGLLGSTSFCRRVSFGSFDRDNVYQTVNVRNLWAFWVRIFGAVEGECGDVCPDVCNHKSCVQDYESLDETLCECLDVTESSCASNTKCNEASDNCECNKGYEGNPLVGCTDIDECRKNPTICGPGFCNNTIASYQCTCNPGYQFRNGTCVDFNECNEGTPCGTNALCTNTVGSFTCACNKGFTGTPPSVFCTDINECFTGVCGPNGGCTNTDGAFTCQCFNGYRSTAPTGGCIDRDECRESNSTCALATENCVNTEGSFVCTCKLGFTGSAGSCVDVNECNQAPAVCGPDSTCTNNVGSFGCKCNDGFFSTPPNCRKRLAFERCASVGECSAGLKCALTSRSETTTTSCCAETARCGSSGECCNGAYAAGQPCPSGIALDCRDGLTCANRPFSNTKICCSRAIGSTCL